jgi:hypothetical protein
MILRGSHDSPLSGHAGVDRTLHNVRRTFWWPNQYVDIVEFVKTCDSCQRNKASTQAPAGLLRPLPIPNKRWQSVSMDFIVSLPKTASGHDAIVVFVCRLIKMVHFAKTTSDVTAEEVANLFFDNVVRLHGMPTEIVSDRGTQFISLFWKRLCLKLGIQRAMSTAFHPQTDGQTERMNRVLEDVLRHYVSPTCDDWDEYLFAAEFAVNNAVSKSTTFTPFYLCYGEHPPTPLTCELRTSDPSTADQLVTRIQESIALTKRYLLDAQSRQKQYADARRRPCTFKLGDKVLLSAKNIHLKVRKVTKLFPKYIGPFVITRVINPVAFELELPPQYKVHPVFHASLLKEYKESVYTEYRPPPPLEWLDGDPVYEVEKILLHRDRRIGGGRTRREYLIKWKGYPVEHNTWQNESAIVNCDRVLAKYWAYANTA